jgi:hypothetical protein
MLQVSAKVVSYFLMTTPHNLSYWKKTGRRLSLLTSHPTWSALSVNIPPSALYLKAADSIAGCLANDRWIRDGSCYCGLINSRAILQPASARRQIYCFLRCSPPFSATTISLQQHFAIIRPRPRPPPQQTYLGATCSGSLRSQNAGRYRRAQISLGPICSDFIIDAGSRYASVKTVCDFWLRARATRWRRRGERSHWKLRPRAFRICSTLSSKSTSWCAKWLDVF